MKKIVLLSFLFFLSIPSFAQKTDTLNVYFPLNQRTLSPQARFAIDSFLYQGYIIPGQNLIIIGYADYLAGNAYNNTLSKDRAKNVETYLLRSGFKTENIRLCIGKGEIERQGMTSKAGYAQDRKVQIVIDHNRTNRIVKKTQERPKHKKDITELKPNETLTLDNIYFLPGRHTVRQISMPELEKLYQVMKDHPTLKIQIEGHICCITMGFADGYDMDGGGYHLSTDRAKAIYDYLVDKGIDPDRMKYKGFGRTRPLVDPERTPEDEDKNRRVEIRILEK